MANPYRFLLCFSVVIIQTTMFAMFDASTTTTSSRHSGGFSLPLIHRHSIHADVLPTDMTGPLMPIDEGSLFLVNVSIGQPPLPQLLVMDTGSDLTWVQCTNCKGCHVAILPTHDPAKSSTFIRKDCGGRKCHKLKQGVVCDPYGEECTYSITYLDGTSSSGNLASEKFTFETSDDGIVELPNSNFGCAHIVKEPLWKINGVLGLGFTVNSMFVGSNFTKFSYCIGNISDPTYKYNMLIVGDDAILQGDSVPMLPDNFGLREYYHVELHGISVGGKHIEITNPMNFLIDSGTTYTYLKKDPLESLRKEIRELMKERQLNEYPLVGNLCFRGEMQKDLYGFPTTTLSLGGGGGGVAGLQLNVEGVFYQRSTYEKVFCLALKEAKDNEDNVIGIKAQQYYNIGFDLENSRVSFQQIDCELFDS